MLHIRSFHNPRVKRAIPEGQFIRAKRITSCVEKYEEAKMVLTKRFKERGGFDFLPQYFLLQVRTYFGERQELHNFGTCFWERSDMTGLLDIVILQETHMTHDKILSLRRSWLSSTYHACYSNYARGVSIMQYSGENSQKYWPLLQADRQYGHLFNDPPRFCYKRGRTLKEMLCPSDTCQKKSLFHGKKKKGTYPCLGCNCCSAIIKGSKINHPKKGYEINLHVYATCMSTHVVYLLKCPCGLGYVGQTSRAVKIRIQEHKSNIRNFKENTQTDTSVSKHFFIHKHNSMQLRWCVLEEAAPDGRGDGRINRLLQIEGRWIKRLGTLYPDGLNDSWSLKPYL
ncbi:hypothetical protein XELAEV_18031481mg [Xenopus laevis]|uniref:Helix-turn-helix domain-containing protein n=1 Tax=Xenopus laevis TaxID=8355 RepID=A0A974CMP9_XENLA|nr:hypothetical protein XELAEV_18031481mg [Xenopus laevis]